jgi:hypothetical protein
LEFIKELTASDPERAIAILEKGVNDYPTEAVGVPWIVNENFEVVAVVPVQSILGAKPHKALIVLHNVGSFCLRQPVGCGEACESDVRPIDDGQFDWPRIYACLWYCAVRESAIGRAHVRNHAGKQAQT